MTQDNKTDRSSAPETKADTKTSGAKKTPTAKVSKPADRVAVAQSKPAKQGTLWLVIVLLAFAISALGYMQWLAQSQRTALTSDQSGQSEDLQRWQQQQLVLAQKIDNLSSTNKAALNVINTQQADLQIQQTRMDAALATALENMAKTQLDQGQVLPQWQLAEAEYLLRLANQRLAMEQASESAIALLKAADIIIRDNEQVGTYGIRRAIAADLLALTAVPSVDVEGVYAQLAALSGLAEKLTFIPPRSDAPAISTTPKAIIQNTDNASAAQQSWIQNTWQGTQHVAASVWGELKQLVKIQSRTQEDQQLLTPAAELLVRMRIEMALSQTQVALLRRQQTIYDQSLVSVQQLLTQYYRSNDAVAQAMRTQIDTLNDVKVLVTMPNISGSLVALQGFVARLHDAAPAVGD
ncbi:MAG: uroporphyrinogen-III C-methyltransferase [Gammaproteobacteria bacterium]|nr:uroporphyrinogen-III C-methyltransferase [Gammaproteobacteria bacterium]